MLKSLQDSPKLIVPVGNQAERMENFENETVTKEKGEEKCEVFCLNCSALEVG